MDSSAAVPRAVPWIINRSYTLLLVGGGVSVMGDYFFDTTLLLWIAASVGAGQAWAPAAVSGLLLAASVSTVAVGGVAGVFVDRWDRRAIMLTCDGLRALVVVGLLVASGLVPGLRFHLGPQVQLAVIYATVLLSTACGQFFTPARSAILADVVPERRYAQAASFTSLAQPFATIIGPPLAAPLYFSLGPGWALVANAASFALSFAAVWLARLPRVGQRVRAEASYGEDLREGVGFVLRNRIIRTVLITATIAMLGAGATNALDIFFVRQNLHAPYALYGLLSGGFGAGLLAGGIGAPAVIARLGLLRTFRVTTVMAGVLFVVYSRMNGFAPALVLYALLAVPVAMLNIAIQPILLTLTPSRLMGRVEAVLNPVVSLATVLSMGGAGLADSTFMRGFHARFLGMTFGPVDTIFTVSGLIVLCASLYGWVAMRGQHMPGARVREGDGALSVPETVR